MGFGGWWGLQAMLLPREGGDLGPVTLVFLKTPEAPAFAGERCF